MKISVVIGIICLVCVLSIGLGNSVVANEEPYHYWYAPENSFGITETKNVNWSYFKDLFRNNFDINLYYRVNGGEWQVGNQYLGFTFDWQDEGYWKINTSFDNPSHQTIDASFEIRVKRNVLNYIVDNDNYTYYLEYPIPNTNETYKCFINWSDLANINGMMITKYWTGQYFNLRFTKMNVPYGYHVFDPKFGHEDAETSNMELEDTVGGAKYTCPLSCTLNNFTAYIKIASAVPNKVRGAVYDTSYNLIGVTDAYNATDTGPVYEWQTIPISATISLSASTDYYFVLIADGDEMTDGHLARSGSGKTGTMVYNFARDYDLGYADPMDFSAKVYSGYNVSLYIGYTESGGWSNTAPTQTSFTVNGQVNGSTGIELYPQLNITVSDADGNNTVVYWSTNGSSLYQINGSAVNRTCRDMNFSFASSYSTKYYVEISVNDSHDNVTKWYCFTTKAAPFVNTAPVCSNPVPANNAVEISEWPMLNITVSDADGHSMNVTWWTNATGSWSIYQVNSSVANGTYRDMNFSYADEKFTWFWWNVSVDDGHGANVSCGVYKFRTDPDRYFLNGTIQSTNYDGTQTWTATGPNIQQAIWSLNDTGGTVYLPVGNLTITSPLQLNVNVTLIGHTYYDNTENSPYMGTRIIANGCDIVNQTGGDKYQVNVINIGFVMANGYNGFWLYNYTDIYMVGCSIRGNADTGYGIYLSKTYNSIIRDFRIVNCDVGIYVEDACNFIRIENGRITSCDGGIYFKGGNINRISFVDCSGCDEYGFRIVNVDHMRLTECYGETSPYNFWVEGSINSLKLVDCVGGSSDYFSYYSQDDAYIQQNVTFDACYFYNVSIYDHQPLWLNGGTRIITEEVYNNCQVVKEGDIPRYNFSWLDIWLDNSTNELNFWNGTSWETVSGGADTVLSQEEVEDYVGGMIGQQVNITVTYNDATGNLTFIVNDAANDTAGGGNTSYFNLSGLGSVSGSMDVDMNMQISLYIFVFWAILAFLIVRGRKPFEVIAASMIMILFTLWMYMDISLFHSDYFMYLGLLMILVGFGRSLTMDSDKSKVKGRRYPRR